LVHNVDQNGTMMQTSGAQSVDRTLSLLAMVGRYAERGVSLSGIVTESGLSKPTARRLLLALMRAGLIEQNESDRRYYLGEEAYVLGSLASRRFGLLQLSMDSLQRLSKTTEDTSFLSVRRGALSICLYREEGSYPVRTHALQAGFEHPLGAGAGSLAILSSLPDEEVEAILAANQNLLEEQYPLLPPERIRKDVAVTRARGFALNPGLVVANSWGVGKVILSPDGRPAGALSIAAIDSRLQKARQTELAGYLAQEASIIEQKLVDMFRAKGTPVVNGSRMKGILHAAKKHRK
jgi:DNA-binding IclR family transcriptional regulator